MAPPLNVLLITVDQWRGDCLGHLGHMVATPAIDQLAASGACFARHYSQAAPCGPARAGLYTGTYLLQHRSVNNGTPLDDHFTNIAREARALGYDPQLFGYTDTSLDPRTLPADDPRLRSYESVLPGFSPACHLPEGNPKPWVDWLVEEGIEVPDDWRRLDDTVPGRHGLVSGYDLLHSQTAFLTDRALEWIETRGEDRPWFVHISYLRPHPPFVVCEPYHDRYDQNDTPRAVRAATREEEADQHPLMAALVRHPLTRAGDDDEVAGLRATYYGMQSEVDHWLGALFAGLKALGEWGRTLVVLTSDHGEQLGDHWCMGKLGWFDESFHVPLVVRDPRPTADASRGQVVQEFTEHVDIVPTILDLLGAEIPTQCDGRSLRPFLAGGAPHDWRREVHFEFDFRDPQNPNLERAFNVSMEETSLCVIRDDLGKYVQFGNNDALPPLFFALEDDPAMLTNRADDPDLAAVVLDYAQRMLAWRLRHADRTLANTKLSPLGATQRYGPRR